LVNYLTIYQFKFFVFGGASIAGAAIAALPER